LKALIIPTANKSNLHPLMSWFPEFLIPVVNKPIVSHTIELLVQNNIKEIILILKHMPYETELYFGNGERWGANISYSLENDFESIAKTLRHISTKLNDTIIVCSSNTITNMNISDLLKSHKNNNADFTLVQSLENNDQTSLNKIIYSKRTDFSPFILSEKAITTILDTERCENLDQNILELKVNGLKVNPCKLTCYIKQIDSVSDYWDVNNSILNDDIKGLILPGWEREKGIWIGRNTKLNSNLVLSPPIIIGDNCVIGKNVELNKNCIIGDNVIIDDNSIIENSIVMSGTYVGQHTELKNSLARKNNLFNLTRKVNTFINDDFILGDVQKKTFSTKSSRLMNIFLSLTLLILCSPIYIILMVYNLIFPNKKILSSKKQICGIKMLNLEGKSELKYTELYYFKSKKMLIKKLPGLFSVLKGDINLIGITAPSIENGANKFESLQEFSSLKLIGLFTLSELESMGETTEEEAIVINNYYIAKRSVWFDLSIMLKSLFKSI